MPSTEFVVQPALRILEFQGRLTFGAESEKRYEELCAFIRAGSRHFIFDLSGVADADAAGIGFLVTCLTAILRVNGSLALAAPSNRVLYSLLITRLDTVFPLFESVEKALRHGAAQDSWCGAASQAAAGPWPAFFRRFPRVTCSGGPAAFPDRQRTGLRPGAAREANAT